MRMNLTICTAQKMKFSIKDFFSECDQIRSFLRIWSHLLKKSLIKNFIFCAMMYPEEEEEDPDDDDGVQIKFDKVVNTNTTNGKLLFVYQSPNMQRL